MKSSPHKKIIFICTAAALGGLLFGFDTAVISGTVEAVKRQFGMSVATEGWFVSSGLLGCILGVVVAGLISDALGRKKALLLSAVLFLLSGIVCAWAASVNGLVAGRLLGGLGVGIVSVAAPMYITEFAPSKSRGSMVALYQLAITIGIVMAYFSNALMLSLSEDVSSFPLFGSWLGNGQAWRGMFLVMVVPSLLYLLFIAMVPESPRWLIAKNRTDAALKILRSVREGDASSQEYQTIVSATETKKTSNRSVFSKAVRYPLFIGIMLAVFQQFCGINAIIYYGPKIFETAGLTTGSALQTQIVIGVVNVLFTLFAISQADKFGRRPLLLTGLAGIIVSLVVAGFCFYTGQTGGWLLVGCILLFVACFAFSLGPVTWILINEIFPTDLRVKAVSICTMAVWLSVWVIGQFFPLALSTIGPSGVFWCFAAISFLNLLFVLKLIKETKGQSLESVEMVYAGGH